MKCSLKSFCLIIAFLVAFSSVEASAQSGKPPKRGLEIEVPPFIPPSPEDPPVLISPQSVTFVDITSALSFTAEVYGRYRSGYNIPVLHFEFNCPLNVETVILAYKNSSRKYYYYVQSTTSSIEVPAPINVGVFYLTVTTSDCKKYSTRGQVHPDGTISFGDPYDLSLDYSF